MSYQKDLDWLARNVHKWPAGHQGWLYIITNGDGTKGVATSLIGQVNCPWVRIEIQDWLARRAELQNKPSWDLSGSWSKYLAQDMDGEWKWLGENPSLGDEDWTADELRSQCKGVVIGDWRDTLERRPAELSEQAVTERLAETTKIVLAAAPALMDEKFSFDRNDWHERGELPPVGTRCEALITSERQWVEIEVVCHRDGFALGWCPKERCGYHGDEPTDFRPIRTERDLAVDEMKRHCPYHGSWETTYKLFAEALYDAGYRAGGAA